MVPRARLAARPNFLGQQCPARNTVLVVVHGSEFSGLRCQGSVRSSQFAVLNSQYSVLNTQYSVVRRSQVEAGVFLSMKTIWTVVLAAAAAWGQSVYPGSTSTTGAAAWPGGGLGGIVCGPPNYNCSRTDLNAQQLPSTIPSMGGGSNPPLTGAGMIVLDDLNNANRIVRCTDAAFDPNTPNKGYTAGPGGSGDENIWNADSTMLFLQSTGAVGYPVAFNSSTLQCSR